MLAIETKYVPATNYKPSRIIATVHDHNGKPVRRTVSWEYGMSGPENHRAAAVSLMIECGPELSMVASGDGKPGTMSHIVGRLL